MAEDTEPQTPPASDPTPATPPPADDERARLARERDEAVAVAQRIREEAEARDRLWQERVTQLSQPATPPQQNDISDDEILTGRQFKVAAANIMATLAGATQQEIIKIHKGQRAANREYARNRLPNFSKYEKDIEEYLDRVPPEIGANPAVYDEAYRLARAKYVDDDVRDRSATEGRRLARELLESKGLDPADFGLDVDLTTPTTSAAANPSTPPPATSVPNPAAPGTATPRPAVSVRSPQAARVRLNQQQSYVANRLGVTADDFARYSDDDVDHDFLGSKGRSRF